MELKNKQKQMNTQEFAQKYQAIVGAENISPEVAEGTILNIISSLKEGKRDEIAKVPGKEAEFDALVAEIVEASRIDDITSTEEVVEPTSDIPPTE